jgi:putative salt-induced outer membrane protein YdiY
MGAVSISLDEVESIVTDAPKEVLLTDDTVITAQRFEPQAKTVVVADADGSDARTLAVSDIDAVNPEGWETGRTGKWIGSFEIGLRDQTGNTEMTEYDGKLDTTYRRKDWRVRGYGELGYSETNSVKSRNNWRAGVTPEINFTSKWYAGFQAHARHDEFADLNLRTTLGPMLGYRFFEGPSLNLLFDAGVYHLKDDRDLGEDSDSIGPGWHFNYNQKFFTDRLTFYHEQFGFTAASGDSKTTWDAWTGFQLAIAGGFYGAIEHQVNYDSNPTAGFDDTEAQYLFKLGYGW